MAGNNNDTIIRFEKVNFEHAVNKPILDLVSFNVRRGMKVTIMGQNGAGKSTLFSLITKVNIPDDGEVHIANKATIAISRQVIPRDELALTVREFFQKCFKKKVYDIDPRIDEVLDIVHLIGHEKVHDRVMSSFSGGQQARLLLAQALIQDPDILLLDEPTNNLDHAGIKHLTDFLIKYKKTVLVISHDAEFLNSFTDAVLYLDVYTHKIEQYVGNYYDVVEQIKARIERENRQNALLSKEIQAKKDQANAFAMKGGNLRAVAKRMRELAEDLEEEKVDVRKEDKTIRPFTIPFQGDLIGDILTLTSVSVLKNHKPKEVKVNIKLRKNKHLQIVGPNGIGKTTLLENIVNARGEGIKILEGTRIGYYRQDFSNLDFSLTVYESLANLSRKILGKVDEEYLRKTAATFLIVGDTIHTQIGHLSEGQKGLVAFAHLVIEKPGLLILDEPTNHINFRHIPVIAEALDKYEGAMIIVSHVPDFIEKIRIDEVLDLGK